MKIKNVACQQYFEQLLEDINRFQDTRYSKLILLIVQLKTWAEKTEKLRDLQEATLTERVTACTL